MFICECQGLKQLSRWIIVNLKEIRKNDSPILHKIQIKLKVMLYDFILNDDNIIKDDPTFIRDKLSNDKALMLNLFNSIEYANLKATKEF